MILKQHYLGCLSQASYLVGDESSGVAAVIDPRRDVDEYVAEAARHGMRIRYVVLTHFHADFVSGHLELREKTGAEILLGARAQADYPFRPLREGDVVSLGQVRLQAMETPGHTPESICLVVYDAAHGAAPHAVFTGDTLFVGDVGRPDLLASEGVTAAALADMLHGSVRRLLELPDETLVYPAHGPGSMCGKNLGPETMSTIGAQRRTNPMLSDMPLADFVRRVSEDQPEAPGYFAYDAAMNKRDRPTLDAAMRDVLRPLPLDRVTALARGGAQVLDAREPAAYAAGHLRGSVNAGLSGKYATWAGTVLDREAPIVLVVERGREREAAMRLGRIGFDRVAGYLDGMPNALERSPPAVRSSRVDPPTASRMLEDDPATFVLDVRTPTEWRSGHVRGSTNVPLSRLGSRLDEIPRDRPILVHCQSGYRSSIAASLLERAGFTRVTDLAGGMNAWAFAGLPSETAGAVAGSG